MAEKTIGPKEQQLRAMRAAKAQATKPVSIAKLRESVAKVKPNKKKKKHRPIRKNKLG